MNDEIPSIGAELIEHARSNSVQPRGLMDDLFPFIYEASKRLSSRAISRWLEQEKGIKISNVTVAKALRNPEKYWETFAERLEPSIRTIENETGAAAESFLEDERITFALGGEASLRLRCEDANGDGRGNRDLDEAVQLLKECWYPLGAATRKEITPYLLGTFPPVARSSTKAGEETDES